MVTTSSPSVVVKSVEAFVTKVVIRVVENVVENLRRPHQEGGTPVLTGWASANWIPNIGKPRSGPAGTREAAEVGTLPDDSDRMLEVVRTSYKLKMGAIYITNAVPYIGLLNDGSSAKAPAGFVQSNIVKAITVDLRGFNGR